MVFPLDFNEFLKGKHYNFRVNFVLGSAKRLTQLGGEAHIYLFYNDVNFCR